MYLLFVQKEEYQVSYHRQCGNDVWVSATRLVFEQAGILSPVVSDLASGPMSADQRHPLLRRIFVQSDGGYIVARFALLRI